MSDSPTEENKPLPSTSDGNKAPLMRPVPQEPEKTKLPTALKLIALLAAIAVIAFVFVIASQLSKTPQNQTATNTDDENSQLEPLSILPIQPEGTTVLAKQPDQDENQGTAIFAPIAQGGDIATGFAIDMGATDSYIELSGKFAEIVETNGAENFQRLEPRAILRETVSGLEARLLIGPFETLEQAKEACDALILPPDTPCIPDTFQGDLIPRQ